MSPLEPQKPEQAIKLKPLPGTLLCLALPLLCWGLFLLLELPHHTGDVTPIALQSLCPLGAATFVVRLFQWCDTDHLLKAAMALPILMFLSLFGLSPDQPSLAFTTSIFMFLGLLITGAIGMAIGGFVSRRTADAKRPALIRSALSAAILGLALGPSLYGCCITAPAVRKAERTGPANLKANASGLAHTVISPTLTAPITEGTNVIWCGTFQLAWNELCSLAGGEVHMTNEAAVVAQLNSRSLGAKDLDESTYIAAAALACDTATDNLRRQLAKKFKGAMNVELINAKETLPTNSIVLYAALFAQLPFERAFGTIQDSPTFKNVEVAAFGIDLPLIHKSEQLIGAQIKIFDKRSGDDFIVELKTKRDNHQLFLAKIPPEPTLDATVQTVLTRISRAAPTPFPKGGRFVVPVIDFDLLKDYPEVANRPLSAKNPILAGNPILRAQQSVRFKLDKYGAVLKSEAAICATLCKMETSNNLIFDRPFLVLLKLTASDKPYFAMWVDNPEVLVQQRTNGPEPAIERYKKYSSRKP